MVDVRERILQEHAELHGLLVRLERPREPAGLAPMLAELHSALEQHFQVEEEEDGLYEILLEKGPQHRQTIDELLAQHPALLGDVRVLIAQARAQPGALIAVRARQFSSRVRDHEQRETHLLLAVLTTRDVGDPA